MCLISCGDRLFLVLLGFLVCLCRHHTENTVQTLPVSVSVSLMLRVINVYLLGTQSEPVLQPVLGEPNAIEDEEARRVGVFEARGGPRVKVHIWGDAQAPSDCVVAHVHQLV